VEFGEFFILRQCLMFLVILFRDFVGSQVSMRTCTHVDIKLRQRTFQKKDDRTKKR